MAMPYWPLLMQTFPSIKCPSNAAEIPQDPLFDATLLEMMQSEPLEVSIPETTLLVTVLLEMMHESSGKIPTSHRGDGVVCNNRTGRGRNTVAGNSIADGVVINDVTPLFGGPGKPNQKDR